MSDFACECGKVCKTEWHLNKHKEFCKWDGTVLEHDHFSNRFVTAGNVCPICLRLLKSFHKKDDLTWVCLECGTHFTPREKLEDLRAECAGIKWKRPQT